MSTGTELVIRPTPAKRRFAVVGAGPAGLSAAITLAERGHAVDLFDAAPELGGQLNMAKTIPGKEEFHEMLRYFTRRVDATGVTLRLGARVDAQQLLAAKYDEIIIATGVSPRNPKIPGQDHPSVLSYIDVLRHRKPVGKRVAIVGAGGIGFDVAEFLALDGHSPTLDLQTWRAEWGVGDPTEVRGGVDGIRPEPQTPAREIVLLQRRAGKLGGGLGKTTGWIHRTSLKNLGVRMVGGVNYERIGDEGLLVSYGEKREAAEWLPVDSIVLCAGQEPLRELVEPLQAGGAKVHVIGGADEALELDAKRAIDQGTRLAASL